MHRFNSDSTTYPIDPELLMQYGEINSPVILGLSELGDWGYGGPEIAWSKLKPVYRFYSPTYKNHFFTIIEPEKDDILENDPNWILEGVAFYAYYQGDYPSDANRVYRFRNTVNNAHFYTVSRIHKKEIEDGLWGPWVAEPDGDFYAYKRSDIDPSPVYRFLSIPDFRGHFYTIDEGEKDSLLISQDWFFEDEAFRAIPVASYTKNRLKERPALNLYNTNGTEYCGTYKDEVKWSVGNGFYGDRFFNPLKNN